jgi:hypothetical protein
VFVLLDISRVRMEGERYWSALLFGMFGCKWKVSDISDPQRHEYFVRGVFHTVGGGCEDTSD